MRFTVAHCLLPLYSVTLNKLLSTQILACFLDMIMLARVSCSERVFSLSKLMASLKGFLFTPHDTLSSNDSR